MIGKYREYKTGIKSQNAENSVNSQTSLGRHFHATGAHLDTTKPGYYYIAAIDDSWDGNKLKLDFFSPSDTEGTLEIGGDTNIFFWFREPDGWTRLDTADRGIITFHYDAFLQKISGSFKFEVDNEDGTLAYTFTQGVFNLTNVA